MKYLPVLFVCVLPLIAAAILYIRYRQTPHALWSRRVHSRVAELKSRREALVNPANRQQSPAEKLAEELFRKQRQNVPASVLQKYDNIGPATIEQLRKAGITNLVDAEEHVTALLFKKKIENLGEFRENALKAAVSEHVIEERRRFDAGSSPEGAEYQRRLANLSADEQAKAAAKAWEVAALEACLDRMRDFEAAADRINFTGWVLRQPSPVDDDFLAKPFPSVEVAEAPAPVPTPSSPPTTSSKPTVATPSGPPPQLAKLQAYCRFALIVAKADGRIAASERSTIRNYLAGRFGSDVVLMRHIDPQLEQAEADLPSEEDAIAGIKSAVPRDEWAGLYEFATQVADSAGGRNTKETQYLADLAAALNLSPEVAAPIETKILTPPISPPPPVAVPVLDHRAALDIDAKTPLTAELVRRKYAMLLESTAKAKSLGGQYAKMAEAQEAAGKLAAEALMADLGEPLVKPVPEESKDLRHNPDLDDLFK